MRPAYQPDFSGNGIQPGMPRFFPAHAIKHLIAPAPIIRRVQMHCFSFPVHFIWFQSIFAAARGHSAGEYYQSRGQIHICHLAYLEDGIAIDAMQMIDA